MKHVFLLWDKSREEHGEEPQLIDVYESNDAAARAEERMIREEYGAPDDKPMLEVMYDAGYDVYEDYEIEMREVKS